MDRLAGPFGKTLVRILVALGAAGLVWAALGLFWPVRMTTLSGALDSGKAYTVTFATPGLNSLYGLLTLLAASVNAAASIRLFQGAYSALKVFLWAVFSGVMLAAAAVVGATPVISWMSDIPAEIQHGIGTPYVKVIEKTSLDVPLLVAAACVIAYLAAAALYAAMSQRSR